MARGQGQQDGRHGGDRQHLDEGKPKILAGGRRDPSRPEQNGRFMHAIRADGAARTLLPGSNQFGASLNSEIATELNLPSSGLN